jgi:hypothetical protein
MITIGIDPGVSGAIAIIHGDRIAIHDCPLLPKEGKWNRHNSWEMFRLLLPYQDIATAVIEHVRFDSRDDRHKGSAEILVRSHESWLTCLSILGIETHSLEVPQWRRLAGSTGCGSDEKAIVDYTCQLFPQVRAQLKRRSGRAKAGYVYMHNHAEALLMAYAAQQLQQKEAIA